MSYNKPILLIEDIIENIKADIKGCDEDRSSLDCNQMNWNSLTGKIEYACLMVTVLQDYKNMLYNEMEKYITECEAAGLVPRNDLDDLTIDITERPIGVDNPEEEKCDCPECTCYRPEDDEEDAE